MTWPKNHERRVLMETPCNYEARTLPGSSRLYYLDHDTSLTHWIIPRNVASAAETEIDGSNNEVGDREGDLFGTMLVKCFALSGLSLSEPAYAYPRTKRDLEGHFESVPP